MLHSSSFDCSRFVINNSYSLPLTIPMYCQDTVIFSLKTESIYSDHIFLWNHKKAEFILNILFYWDEIADIFEQVEKSLIYASSFSELFVFTLKRSFIRKFDTIIEAIAHGRLLLELVVEKANKAKICQMNYLTVYEYLEMIEVHDMLLFDS